MWVVASVRSGGNGSTLFSEGGVIGSAIELPSLAGAMPLVPLGTITSVSPNSGAKPQGNHQAICNACRLRTSGSFLLRGEGPGKRIAVLVRDSSSKSHSI